MNCESALSGGWRTGLTVDRAETHWRMLEDASSGGCRTDVKRFLHLKLLVAYVVYMVETHSRMLTLATLKA